MRRARPIPLLVLALAVGLAPGCDRFALPGAELLGGGGGGGGGGDPPPPPPPLPGAPSPALVSTLGLTDVAGGDGVLRVDYRPAPAHLDPAPQLALLMSPDPRSLTDAAPIALDPAADQRIVSGLANGEVLHVVLAAGAPGEPLTPVGPVLTARTGPPLYVDPETATPGDGSSPQAPLNDLVLAVLLAFGEGGRNVWVAPGAVENLGLPLLDGVHLLGGFDPSFELKARDPTAHVCRLIGSEVAAVATVQHALTLPVLSGFQLEGGGTAPVGVDVINSPFEGRQLRIVGCKRGFKLRQPPEAASLPATLAGCSVEGTELQGVSVEGPFDLFLDGCQVSDSGQEGAELGKWYAPPDTTVRCVVRASSFVRNGLEGLDIDLDAPPDAEAPGGRFELLVEDCDFQLNATAGLLIDIDYEAFPDWSADVTVRGCRSRANLGPGVDLDLDASASVLLHRLSVTANGGPGLSATSETAAGTLVVSASALWGNQGGGVVTDIGNFGALLSHCAVSGNVLGGLEARVAPGAATSGVAYLQPAPSAGFTLHFGLVQDVPTPLPFVRAADEFARVVGFDGALLQLELPPSSGGGALAELADDGVARTVAVLGGTELSLEPTPELVALPSTLAFFPEGEGVDEDLRLAPASQAEGAGMPPIAGGLTDAGVFGSPSGGPPGVEDAVPAPLFRLAGSVPPWTLPIGAGDTLQLEFRGGAPDPATLGAGVRVVDGSLAPAPADAWVEGERVHVAAPAGGWVTGMRVELHAGLGSVEGRGNACPLAIPMVVQ